MNQMQMFGGAEWLTAPESNAQDFWILRGKFCTGRLNTARLRVLGLGFFHCYINGRRVGNDLFLPLNSEFEPRKDYPTGEKLTGYHTYVPEFDVLPLLHEGENVIAVHFGGGWYTGSPEVAFGGPKVIWQISGTDENGAFECGSSAADRIAPSYVKGISGNGEYRPTFACQENHDYLAGTPDMFSEEWDDRAWMHAVPARALETEYAISDCPPDRVIRTLPVQKIGVMDGYTVYDCGVNTTGWPVLRLKGEKGSTAEVLFAEEATPDGQLHPDFMHNQRMRMVSDGTERLVHPLFTWFGFRYFAVNENAEPIHAEVVHADVQVTSSFATDNELLNWIHDTYLNTQLTNLHAGIPSDCPHIERRGYTGDGQLACHAAMNLLDAEKLYRKWMQDIADTQDTLTGHIQYTAPYVRSGGGPGGWGCAIVEVPWQFYQHYGDASVLSKYYPAMLRYFDYLESRSQNDLVVTDKEGEWCLGDWCPPIEVVLPAPFVNNYFYVKSLERCIRIARIIGQEADIPMFEKRIAVRKKALMNAYFNKWDGNFLGNQQGANAFMADIGLGDHRTYKNLAERCRKLKRYDTGIFGTDIVTRVLFEHGDGQLAVDLLLAEHPTSFDGMRKLGATTLWEYWPGSLIDRSHNHPMFGAVAAYLYDYIAGIRAKDGCAGYSEIEIAPVLAEGISRLNAFRTLPAGKVSVSYEKTEEGIRFEIEIPRGLSAVLKVLGQRFELNEGSNQLKVREIQ